MSDIVPHRPPHAGSPRRRERDFLLLNIFVFAQHGYVGRARTLADALYLMGDSSAEVLFTRAVTRFLTQDWADTLRTLEELDRADPIERFGTYRPTPQHRMRRYMKARSLFALDLRDSAGDMLEAYLRHGVSGVEEPE